MLTDDIRNIPDFAHERIGAGLAMSVLFIVRAALPIAVAIDDLALIAAASDAAEWHNQVVYLPLM